MRKPDLFDATDAHSVRAWLDEVRELMTALREAGMDATAKDRVHSRKELRRRMSKQTKRLYWLLEALRPVQTPPEPPVASEAQVEKLRLVSMP